MNECPECGSKLKQDTAVQLRGGNIKVVGHYQFCTNMDCNFETD